MSKSKTPMTADERKALGERLRRGREAKQLQREQENEIKNALNGLSEDEPADPADHPAPTDTVTIPAGEYADIKSTLEEFKRMMAAGQLAPAHQYQPAMQQPQYNPMGGLVGTFEKYPVDPNYYPDPSERIANEPRLQRFAFKMNYELVFGVSTTSYQTKDGRNVEEPRFNLELRRIMFDPQTNEPTNTRMTVCRAMFHEDPQAALVVARENGLTVTDKGEKHFLDEMRYIRMRDWVMEAFYPPKPDETYKNARQEVIGNKLVDVYEISSEQNTSIPFSEMKLKG